jgi:hypothetical protein
MTEPKSIFAPPAGGTKPKAEAETLLERVAAAKAKAEAPFAGKLMHGFTFNPNEQAAVLIAMVQAIMGTTPKEEKPADLRVSTKPAPPPPFGTLAPAAVKPLAPAPSIFKK